MLVDQVWLVAVSSFVYDKKVTTTIVVECIMGVFWQLFNFTMVHSVISIVGMLYVETDILRTGNEQLLNDLKEGVIIMDKETSMVMFANNAA